MHAQPEIYYKSGNRSVSIFNNFLGHFTDALGNLNGFFDNLATNLHTMENRNLLPNQMRLLGETDNKPKDSYGHSAAFVNSVSGNMWKRRFEENLSRIQQVRAYQAPMHIRKLMDYMPGKGLSESCRNPRKIPSNGK